VYAAPVLIFSLWFRKLPNSSSESIHLIPQKVDEGERVAYTPDSAVNVFYEDEDIDSEY
jgi:hypothetical protein